ncbi:unnamed protein product [Sphagnum balticum]
MPNSIKRKQKESNSQPYPPLRNRTNSVKTIDTVIYNPPGSSHVDIPEGPEAPSPTPEDSPASESARISQIIGKIQQKTVRFNVSLCEFRFPLIIQSNKSLSQKPNPVTSTREILHATEPPAMLHADEIGGPTPGPSNVSQPGPRTSPNQSSSYTSLIPPQTADGPDLQQAGTQPASDLASDDLDLDDLDLDELGLDHDEASVESDPLMSHPPPHINPSPSPQPKHIIGNPAVHIQGRRKKYVQTATDSEQAMYDGMTSFPPATEKKELVYFLDAEKFDSWKSTDIQNGTPYIDERDYSREDYAAADPELVVWHPILEKFMFMRKSEVRKNPGKVDLERWVAVPRFSRRVDVAPLSSRGAGEMGRREVKLPRRVVVGRLLGWRGCERVFVLGEGWGRVFSGF